jgi:hypothetical protein
MRGSGPSVSYIGAPAPKTDGAQCKKLNWDPKVINKLVSVTT